MATWVTALCAPEGKTLRLAIGFVQTSKVLKVLPALRNIIPTPTLWPHQLWSRRNHLSKNRPWFTVTLPYLFGCVTPLNWS